MTNISTEYISVGGNRHPSAADWDSVTGILAFGTDNNVALWNPSGQGVLGVSKILCGHKDKVNAVKFLSNSLVGSRILLTGSNDHSIRVWQAKLEEPTAFQNVLTVEGHKGSTNVITVAPKSSLFASGAADGTVRVWRLTYQACIEATLLTTIALSPRYLPLALALHCFTSDDEAGLMILAVGGTRNVIQIFAFEGSKPGSKCSLQATLVGHESWVRSLAFTIEGETPGSDILLASASQDKYIRLWRIHKGEKLPAALTDPTLGSLGQTLSNKAYWIRSSETIHSITFEALLLGHEDWIYSASWNPDPGKLQLMTASADNSLAIWEPDPVSGLWVSITRLGGISAQKGSTSATGSTGGFWIGLWSPRGGAVVSLGKTGSWRHWGFDPSTSHWTQQSGISGHSKAVTGLAWEANGVCLLSTSSDQTTRLHAEWRRDTWKTWHEFARPQIHGYDLNCISTLGSARFVSGADEKLLRVFDQPRAVAELIGRLCGIKQNHMDTMPDAANIPVLGLSNKAIEADSVEVIEDGSREDLETMGVTKASNALAIQETPPTEDQLARDTLWPEVEKLYGHGYEISAVATSHDQSLVATSCKASSLEHAVIRLYDTSDWHEIKPSLTAHSLTVTSLCFSPDDRNLLSVGRDRQWTVFKRDSADQRTYKLTASNQKGHSRMILDAAWVPLPGKLIFVTAGRDKTARIWEMDGTAVTCRLTVSRPQAVTAVATHPSVAPGQICLALGEEGGATSVHVLSLDVFEVTKTVIIPDENGPSRTVTHLAWRPGGQKAEAISSQEMSHSVESRYELAVASEDSSLRIYRFSDLFS